MVAGKTPSIKIEKSQENYEETFNTKRTIKKGSKKRDAKQPRNKEKNDPKQGDLKRKFPKKKLSTFQI